MSEIALVVGILFELDDDIGCEHSSIHRNERCKIRERIGEQAGQMGL
ncbi:hypothetical protein [Microvirga sp. P5_D2]